MPQISAEAGLVLRALRMAQNTLSREQIADQTGIDKWAVDEILVSLQIRGLVHCVGALVRPRGRPRNKAVLWKAAAPDLA